jgi:hypothetical protein
MYVTVDTVTRAHISTRNLCVGTQDMDSQMSLFENFFVDLVAIEMEVELGEDHHPEPRGVVPVFFTTTIVKRI